MAINYTMHTEGDLLKVVASGFDENLEDTLGYSLAVVETAIEHRCTRVLCDERELEYRLSTMDTFELANQIAAHAPRLARVALVIGSQNLPNGAFFEDVAVNRGLTVKVFRNLEAACDWLNA